MMLPGHTLAHVMTVRTKTGLMDRKCSHLTLITPQVTATHQNRKKPVNQNQKH